MKRPTTLTVTVAGHKLALRSDLPAETVEGFARELDQRIREIQSRSRVVDTQQVALLAALQMAEALHVERSATAELKRRIRDKTNALLRSLTRGAAV